MNSSYDSIVSWTPEGDGIHIKDIRKFMDQIVPMYFKQTKISSFYRQLNMYHFKLVQKIRPYGKIFKNPQFLKGRADLLNKIPHRMQEYRSMLKNREQKKLTICIDFSDQTTNS